jgi:hypothetical protein
MFDNDNKKPSYDIVRQYFEDNFPSMTFPVPEVIDIVKTECVENVIVFTGDNGKKWQIEAKEII